MDNLKLPKTTKKRLRVIILVALAVIATAAVIFLVDRIRLSLAPDDSGAAGDAKYVLTRTSPAAGTLMQVGTTVTVTIQADKTTGVGVGEIVLQYNTSALTATQINEQGEILALNKNLGTSTGKLTIDIAKSGPGDLPANVALVQFVFTVKSVAGGSTTITVAPESTLGFPNTLGPSGYGTLNVSFGAAATTAPATVPATTSKPAVTSSVGPPPVPTSTVSTSSVAATSSATVSNGAYQLTRTSGTGTLSAGDKFTIAVSANPVGSAKGGEIKITVDPALFTVTQINEEPGILALNKTMNNTTGVAGVHIAKEGPGTLPANTPLVKFSYTVKAANGTTSTFRIASDSKLGVPNILASNGYGSLAISLANSAATSAPSTQFPNVTSSRTSALASSGGFSQPSTSGTGTGNSETETAGSETSSDGSHDSTSSTDETFSETSDSSSDSETSEGTFTFFTFSATSSEPEVVDSSLNFLETNPQIVLLVVGGATLATGLVTAYVWRDFAKKHPQDDPVSAPDAF